MKFKKKTVAIIWLKKVLREGPQDKFKWYMIQEFVY